MTVKIVTDSIADLPPRVVEELGVAIILLDVRFGIDVYRDGVGLTSEQFYDKLVHSKIPPVTSVSSLVTSVGVYDKLAEETDESLTSILSSKLSGAYDVAVHSIRLMKR